MKTGELINRLRKYFKPELDAHCPDVNSVWACKIVEIMLYECAKEFPLSDVKDLKEDCRNSEWLSDNLLDWFKKWFPTQVS